MRNFGARDPKCLYHPYKTSPLKAQGKGGGKIAKVRLGNDAKETASSRHDETNTLRISQRLGQHVQDLYRLKADKIPALKRGSGHEVPLPRKKLFAIDNLLAKENSSSLMECYYVF